MSDQKRDWLKVSQTIANWVMVAIVLVGPPTFRELYDRGYALWMRWVVVLIVLAAAAGLVFRLRSRLWGLAKWAGGKLRDGYVGALWKLVVKPARERFGVEAVKEADTIAPRLTDELCERLRGLDADSLWVLEGAVARRKPGSNEAVLEYPDGMRLEPRDSGAALAKPRFETALKRLESVGAIASWAPVGKETARNFSIKVVLPTTDWKTLERLRVAAEVEWARKSIMEVLKRVQDAAPIVQPEALSCEEGMWADEAEELSIVGAWLLHRILHFYRRYRGAQVLMDAVSLKQLAAEMSEDLMSVLEACDGLAEAGFLSSINRTVEAEEWRLEATVGPKVQGMKVARGLMSAIERRMAREGVW